MVKSLNEKRIVELEQEIEQELASLRYKMMKPVKDRSKYIKVLETRLRRIKWTNKKMDLYSSPSPRMVKQREIFYCELGQNIGSEQDGRRPVVILQNNVGNAHAKITLVAPITSFQHGSIKTIDGKLYLEDLSNPLLPLKELRFYDIPIELEEESKYNIYGVVNISQIRVVSKNRLTQTPAATITVDNFTKIVNAIQKNISIFEKEVDTQEK